MRLSEAELCGSVECVVTLFSESAAQFIHQCGTYDLVVVWLMLMSGIIFLEWHDMIR